VVIGVWHHLLAAAAAAPGGPVLAFHVTALEDVEAVQGQVVELHIKSKR